MSDDRNRVGPDNRSVPPHPASADATVVRTARPTMPPPSIPPSSLPPRPAAADATVVRTAPPGTAAPGAMPVAAKATVDIGEVLGHTYQIDAFLARGGMGAVYRAKHQILESEHAIKLIVPELANDQQIVALMKQEAKALRKVRNDAIVEYQGLFLDEHRRRYLVMEFVDGPSLATLLRDRKFTPDEVRALRDRVALGLHAAHEKGVFHRDLSPDNIILPGGRVENAKIIDFGIAKSTEPGEKSFLDEEFAGKYSYVSPEQAGLYGGKVDGRSDIYSLGLVLAAASIGFGGKIDMGNSPETVVAARQKVPDLSPVAPELRDELAKMLQPNPDDRPASMRDIVSPAALAAVEGAPQIIVREKRSLKGAIFVLLGLFALIGGAVGVHFWRPEILLSRFGTDTAALAADVKKTLAEYRCSTINVAAQQDAYFRNTVRISGFVPTQDDVKRIAVDLAGFRNIDTLDNAVQVVDWPFCEALNVIYTASDGPKNPDLAPVVTTVKGRPDLVFRDGDAIQLDVTASTAFDGYLYVDVIDHEGNVIHMLPTPRRTENEVQAGEKVTLGSSKELPVAGDSIYQVAPPFGTNMVIATSSRKPLFTTVRAHAEQAGPYLDALRHALKAAEDGEGKPISFYRYLETTAK